LKKVRYAVVGAGWISQEAFMPSLAQSGNSELAAIVSGNAANARKLADFYGIDGIYDYGAYDEMLARDDIDAVYIALPNGMHAEYTIRAARAGKHALVEKPLATTVAECEAMIAAADAAGVWLMTAYRLHSEPGTIAILEKIRRGEIGDPRIFSSVFTFNIAAGNHRLDPHHWGGPLQDIGVYCVNAVRHVFGCEPTEVIAMKSHGSDPRFAEVEEMLSVTLRFPGDRLANFTVSFGSQDVDVYRVVGTEGEIVAEPGFRFQFAKRVRLTRGATVSEETFPDVDEFAGQAAYFSDCILKGERPEPDGAEGLADVAIMRAIEEAAATGQRQRIDLPPRPRHPVPAMARELPRTDRRLVF